jgi:hypothetical protein
MESYEQYFKFSSYLTTNTLRLLYKDKPVNNIWGNNYRIAAYFRKAGILKPEKLPLLSNGSVIRNKTRAIATME